VFLPNRGGYSKVDSNSATVTVCRLPPNSRLNLQSNILNSLIRAFHCLVGHRHQPLSRKIHGARRSSRRPQLFFLYNHDSFHWFCSHGATKYLSGNLFQWSIPISLGLPLQTSNHRLCTWARSIRCNARASKWRLRYPKQQRMLVHGMVACRYAYTIASVPLHIATGPFWQ
jgi:hypothetical protein